jgi:hypothetical protein
MGVVHGGGQLPANFQGNKGAVSERSMMRQQQPVDMQIIKSYGLKSRSKADGFCYYYNNKRMNRNV